MKVFTAPGSAHPATAGLPAGRSDPREIICVRRGAIRSPEISGCNLNTPWRRRLALVCAWRVLSSQEKTQWLE